MKRNEAVEIFKQWDKALEIFKKFHIETYTDEIVFRCIICREDIIDELSSLQGNDHISLNAWMEAAAEHYYNVHMTTPIETPTGE